MGFVWRIVDVSLLSSAFVFFYFSVKAVHFILQVLLCTASIDFVQLSFWNPKFHYQNSLVLLETALLFPAKKNLPFPPKNPVIILHNHSPSYFLFLIRQKIYFLSRKIFLLVVSSLQQRGVPPVRGSLPNTRPTATTLWRPPTNLSLLLFVLYTITANPNIALYYMPRVLVSAHQAIS